MKFVFMLLAVLCFVSSSMQGVSNTTPQLAAKPTDIQQNLATTSASFDQDMAAARKNVYDRVFAASAGSTSRFSISCDITISW
jgi:hypothetical protein